MLLTLAKSAGDMYADEEAKLLGEVGQEAFEEAARLEEGVDSEIGRRFFRHTTRETMRGTRRETNS